MLRGFIYLWLAVILITSGLSAGAMGEAEVLDKTYTPEDWEPGGKMNSNQSQNLPSQLQFLEPEEEKTTPLYLKQFISAILNLMFGIGYSAAMFAEKNSWVPWVHISNLLLIGMAASTIYLVAKSIKPGLSLDVLDLI